MTYDLLSLKPISVIRFKDEPPLSSNTYLTSLLVFIVFIHESFMLTTSYSLRDITFFFFACLNDDNIDVANEYKHNGGPLGDSFG